MRWNAWPVNADARRHETRGRLSSRNCARSRFGPAEHTRCNATASTISPTVGPCLGAAVAARAIDVTDDIKLLGHPQQRADIPDRARADGPRVTEVRLERRVDRTQNHLARDRAALCGIPDRLGGHP